MSFDQHAWLDQFLTEEKLPDTYRTLATEHLIPLIDQVLAWIKAQPTPLTLGVNGGQGTGKSTLSAFIAQLLHARDGIPTVIISIDDLYLDQSARRELARDINPLLATRGVPGTHQVERGIDIIKSLKNGQPTAIPRFDKSQDNPHPQDDTLPASGQPAPQLIILEGWCVGARPEPTEALDEPINQLEAQEDPDGTWRHFVNQQLHSHYRTLFDALDKLIMLKTPSFEMIHQWRSEQEAKLRDKLEANGQLEDAKGLMTPDQILRFISHYERLTRWMLEDLPTHANLTLHLNANHNVERITE